MRQRDSQESHETWQGRPDLAEATMMVGHRFSGRRYTERATEAQQAP